MGENEQFDRVEDNPDVSQHKEKYSYLLDRDPLNANFLDYTPPSKEDVRQA